MTHPFAPGILAGTRGNRMSVPDEARPFEALGPPDLVPPPPLALTAPHPHPLLAGEKAGGTRGVGGEVRVQGQGGMSGARRRFKDIFAAQMGKNPPAMRETWV